MLTQIDASAPVVVCAVLLTREKLREMSGYVKRLDGPKCVSAVHDMRVASRRLREVLDLFREYLDPVAFTELEKTARSVTKILGPVRNTDVALRFFRKLQKRLDEKNQHRAIDRILKRLSARRKKQYRTMVPAIEQLSLKRLSRDVDIFMHPPEINDTNSSSVLYELAQPILHQRLSAAFDYQDVVKDEDNKKELHQMRIAFKKARYALEIFQPVFNEECAKVLDGLRGYQETIGAIHDLDIFTTQCERILTKWDKKGKRSKSRKGLRQIIQQLVKLRRELFQEFLTYLEENDPGRMFQDCEMALQRHKPVP